MNRWAAARLPVPRRFRHLAARGRSRVAA